MRRTFKSLKIEHTVVKTAQRRELVFILSKTASKMDGEKEARKNKNLRQTKYIYILTKLF